MGKAGVVFGARKRIHCESVYNVAVAQLTIAVTIAEELEDRENHWFLSP